MSLIPDCPSWLDQTAWDAYCEWRATLPKKQRMTAYARALILNKLSKMREEGQNPTEVLNQSLENCWLGVFPVRKPRQFQELPANDAPKSRVEETARYLAEQAAHAERVRAAREKLRLVADQMRRTA